MKKLLFLLAALALTACEKLEFPNEEKEEPRGSLTIRVAGIDQLPFDDDGGEAGVKGPRRASSVADACERLQFVVFQDESKVANVAQRKGESSFGTASLDLAAGTYQVLVLAHSCSGIATVSTADKISFPSNKVTDTFCYYDTVEVTGEAQEYEVELSRRVAMFRLVVTDDIPSAVAQMKFYYTGGSSTLDGTTGYGCKNSRQTEILDVADGQDTFEVYTFPHAESGELKMTVCALNASGDTLQMRTFAQLPVTRNHITRYTGDFFGGGGAGSKSSWSVSGQTEWEGETDYDF